MYVWSEVWKWFLSHNIRKVGETSRWAYFQYLQIVSMRTCFHGRKNEKLNCKQLRTNWMMIIGIIFWWWPKKQTYYTKLFHMILTTCKNIWNLCLCMIPTKHVTFPKTFQFPNHNYLQWLGWIASKTRDLLACLPNSFLSQVLHMYLVFREKYALKSLSCCYWWKKNTF